MANFTALKTAIQNAIKQNGNEEITGDVLQQILLSIVSTMGDGAINTIEQNLSSETLARQNGDNTLQSNIDAEALTRGNADTQLQNAINAIKADIDNGYVYAGIATPSSTPVSGKVFYIATAGGTYTNFGGQVLTQGINILRFNGSAWSNQQLIGIDDVPTAGSNSLVKSSGVQNELALGAVYDVSAKNPTGGPNNDGKWESLSALLSDTNLNTLIPTAYRKGGMSIKFVHTSDNKYIQARLMAQNFTTDVTQWQGVDDEPTAGSDNLVTSGGVAKYLPKIIIEGNGTTFSKTTINYLQPGRKYKITFWHIWTQPSGLSSVYAFALIKNAESTSNIFFSKQINTTIQSEYIVTIPDDAECVIAGGRAVEGDNIIFNIEPYTDIASITSEVDDLQLKIKRIGHTEPQSVTLGKNKNIYGYAIGLVKDHKYRIDVFSDDTITGTQLSLNIYDKDTETDIIYDLAHNILNSNSWDGAVKSYIFDIAQNYENATIRCYCSSNLSDGVLTYNLYDITYYEINSKLGFIENIEGDYKLADTISNGTPHNHGNANCVRTSPIPVTKGFYPIEIFTDKPLSAEGNYYGTVKYYKNSNGDVIQDVTTPSPDYLTQEVPNGAATTEICIAEFNSAGEYVTLRASDFTNYHIGYKVKSIVENVDKNTEDIESLSSNANTAKELNESSFYEVSSSYAVKAKFSTYGVSHIRIVKGHIYEIEISSLTSYSGSQLSVKAVDYLTNTGFEIAHSVLSNGAWDGSSKTYKFTANSDIKDAKIGSYASNDLTGSNGIIEFTFKDITIDEIKNGRVVNTDIFSLNPETEYIPKIANLRRATTVNSIAITPVSLLWFSDQHDNGTQNIARINAWRNKYAVYIDDVLNTGDSVATKWDNNFSAFLNNGGDKMLMTIGNHDVADPNVSNNYYNGEVSNTDIYNKFMGIMDDTSLNVVRPSNAATLGLCYYYKDYGTRLRLIVVDTVIQDNVWITDTEHDKSYYEAQCTWLTDVLTDAKINGLAVVIANHYTSYINELQNVGGFAYPSTPSSPEHREIHPEFLNIVDTFISGGGEFITWLCGHTHVDHLGTVVDHSNQLAIAVTTSSYTIYRNVFMNNVVRSAGNKSEDAFNMISFDTVNKLIKIVRIGLNYDGFYRKTDAVTINYNTKHVV